MVAQQNSATSSTHSTSKKPTVKTRSLFIIAILALSLAIIFSILVYNYRTTYQNTRNDIIELSKGSSARNAEAIELFFTRHEDLLLAASEVLEYALSNESLDIDAVQTLLHDLSVAYNDNVYQSVFGQEFTGIYASIDGVMVNGMRTPDQLPEGYDPTKRQWYQEGLLGGGAVVFGEPHYDIYYPDTQVMSATKLLSYGETVVGMDITLADMQSAGGDMDVSITLNGQKHDYGHGFILTDCGVVMAHWDSGEQGKCYAVPNNPMFPLYLRIQECLSEGLDYFETTIEGVNYGVFPHQLKNGWYVVTMTDLEDIKTAISSYSQLLLLGTSFVTILASIYCFFISRAYFRAERLTKNLQGALDLATTDGLTGYSNRTAYDMRVHELQQNTGTLLDQSFVYIMIDLNDLKYVNDQIGHVEGDRYIRNCCDLMRSIIPTEIYRIGGDEFAMFLTGDLFELRTVLLDELKKAVTNANLALIPNVDTPSLAIGTAVHFAGESEDIDDLIREADVEMYHNKAVIKKNRLERSEVGYSQDLKLQVLDKQLLTAEMQKSLDDEEFEVWFQPQINNANGETLMGVEALVRWRHPERGMVSPGEFIPLFEYTGMIYQLDLYVWRHACQAMRRWVDEGMTLVPVSVNVSRIDMSQGDFMDKLVSLLAEYEIPYEFFHLEVTESAFGDNEGRIAEVVNELLERGFTVAIDDFGSGYSSLSLLRNVPAQIVKLDMRFFADGNNQTRNSCIIESVIQMCKMLGMAVIAEGVEYKEQADRLRNMGCTYIQGYLYSRPLPYNELKAFAETSLDARTDLLPAPISVDDTDEQARQMFHTIISGTNDAIIVVDSQSMRLLYANPAAEELFDARFDPMHPVTCMEYCQRDPSKACEDCPARGMKPGERREFLSSDKHGHFKSLYMQLDWHGHDAFVFYRTDISAEVREMEFSYALMNNLGVSIALFRAENTSELVPVFCNKEYSQLSGLTPDDFRSSIRKLDSYGVHPDDLQTLRERFGEAFRSGQSVRCHVRAKRADGSYLGFHPCQCEKAPQRRFRCLHDFLGFRGRNAKPHYGCQPLQELHSGAGRTG